MSVSNRSLSSQNETQIVTHTDDGHWMDFLPEQKESGRGGMVRW